ncbi:MAG: hypothetical protein N2252_07480 [Candidatus Kryptonium sp.]|nr:hypothetical protein [Candidatus Kryptonium sp.]
MRKNIYYAIFLFLLIVISIFPNGAFSQDYTDILPHKSEKPPRKMNTPNRPFILKYLVRVYIYQLITITDLNQI